MNFQTSNTTVTVNTLKVDGKKLTKSVLSNLAVVDFYDIYEGALSGRYQFIAKFPIEIFAKLAIAKEKILPVRLTLPSKNDLSDSSAEVSGVVIFDTKLEALVIGWFCNRYAHKSTIEAKKRHELYRELADLSDNDLLNEFQKHPETYLSISNSRELIEFLYVCSKLENERWSVSYGDGIEHLQGLMDYEQTEKWWNEMDKSNPNFHMHEYISDIPSGEWVHEKINQMWERNKEDYLRDVSSDEAIAYEKLMASTSNDLKVHNQYEASPFIYL